MINCKATGLHCGHCFSVGKAEHKVRTHVEEVCVSKQHWLADIAKRSKQNPESVLDKEKEIESTKWKCEGRGLTYQGAREGLT